MDIGNMDCNLSLVSLLYRVNQISLIGNYVSKVDLWRAIWVYDTIKLIISKIKTCKNKIKPLFLAIFRRVLEMHFSRMSSNVVSCTLQLITSALLTLVVGAGPNRGENITVPYGENEYGYWGAEGTDYPWYVFICLGSCIDSDISLEPWLI